MQQPGYHVPVLLQEVMDALMIKQDGIYVDCTFGGGGHAAAMLKMLGPQGRLIAFDQDADARKNLPDDERLLFVPHNFRHLQRFLRLHHVEAVDGLLADLGVSSHQFDEPERGFSTRAEQVALDMRMDQRQELTAADIIASYDEHRLHKLFERFGEVTNAKTLARTIVDGRRANSVATIADFKHLIGPVIKGNPNKYLAQVFQALRMEVNDEMGALKELLQQAPDVLKERGRIAVITFHSIEDRLVKIFFRKGSFEENDEVDLYGNKQKSRLRMVNKKPITATAAELKINPRSRSAKLRVAERII